MSYSPDENDSIPYEVVYIYSKTENKRTGIFYRTPRGRYKEGRGCFVTKRTRKGKEIVKIITEEAECVIFVRDEDGEYCSQTRNHKITSDEVLIS
ncbi:hypothetical protein AC249_AIPGENE14041 [Exaiptasia diaphana]|nr:hypothetical protein AC249_AIPGENE14041 [Exaiptasia diaphana]